MKRTKTRFETVPVAEVLEKALEVHSAKNVEPSTRKEEPYAVPVETERLVERRKLPRHLKRETQ